MAHARGGPLTTLGGGEIKKGIASKLPSETDERGKEAREERARRRGEGENSEEGRRRKEERVQPSTRHPNVPPPTFRTQRQFTGGPEEDIG